MILSFIFQYWHALLVSLSVFAIGAASPGASTLMILNAAITQGRRPAIALSVGVVAGSVTWAIIASAGSLVLARTSVNFLVIMKFVAGFYLLYLSAKSFCSAITPQPVVDSQPSVSCSITRQTLKGLLIHLTNPKAPLVWLATFSVSSEAEIQPLFFPIVIGSCALIAIIIYTGYAFLFSTSMALRAYMAMRTRLEFSISALFGAAAIKMLTSS